MMPNGQCMSFIMPQTWLLIFLRNLLLLKLSDKKVPYYTSSDSEDRVDRALN